MTAPALPLRIQRRRNKGWRMPASVVYVGRPTKWGNPLTLSAAIEAGYLPRDVMYVDPGRAHRFLHDCFRDWLLDDRSDKWWMGPESAARRDWMVRHLAELRGAALACWCRLGLACHADVLIDLANRAPVPPKGPRP